MKPSPPHWAAPGEVTCGQCKHGGYIRGSVRVPCALRLGLRPLRLQTCDQAERPEEKP
jgi:hypothetical protein